MCWHEIKEEKKTNKKHSLTKMYEFICNAMDFKDRNLYLMYKMRYMTELTLRFAQNTLINCAPSYILYDINQTHLLFFLFAFKPNYLHYWFEIYIYKLNEQRPKCRLFSCNIYYYYAFCIHDHFTELKSITCVLAVILCLKV